MREAKVDVNIALDRGYVINAGGFEEIMTSILRRLKDTADRMAAEVGGEVRATAQPEVVVREAMERDGPDVFLISTRWVCDVPEAAPIV